MKNLGAINADRIKKRKMAMYYTEEIAEKAEKKEKEPLIKHQTPKQLNTWSGCWKISPSLKTNDSLMTHLDFSMLNMRIKSALSKIPTIETPIFSNLIRSDQLIEEQIRKRLTKDVSKNDGRQLAQQEIDRVKRSFAPGNHVLVNAFNMEFMPKDMRTLMKGSWLSDEVINFYAQLIMKRAQDTPALPRIHVFNTFFYLKICTNGHAGVKRWSKKVIIPIHMPNHWTCAVINIKRKRFEYYDSLGGSNSACLKRLREYLCAESLDKKKVSIDLSEWTDYQPKDIPHQTNGYDCGVFSCLYMEFSSRDAAFTFQQSQMEYYRTRIAHEILSVKLL